MRVPDRTIEVDSTLTGDKVAMSIGVDALAHIMTVLTDLYADPELAILREYSTNALDAHIDAGNARPIEVTLPTPLSPFLIIRDFGWGLDAEDIHNVYSQYGTSTKRDSDDVVGMLGLGCKSALTYTDQFTLTGVKDGVMTQVSIGRDEDGSGSMMIVAQEPTDEHSGVTVTIPAKRGNDLASKAAHFFSFWTKGDVLVNGEFPARVEGTWLAPDFLLTEGSTSYVVMGNVAYPVESTPSNLREQTNWLGQTVYGYGRRENGPQYVVFAPIGAVNFTPSREALMGNKRTKEYVADAEERGRSILKDSLFAQIVAAKTAWEAQELTRKAQSLGIKDKPQWKGRDVALSLARVCLNELDARGYLKAHPSGYGRLRRAGERVDSIQLGVNDNAPHYFEGFTGKNITPVKRAKLEHWYAQNGKTCPPTWYFVESFTSDEKFWLKGNPIKDWSVIEAVKLPTSGVKGTARLTGSYDVIIDGEVTGETPAASIDLAKPLLYAHGNYYTVMGLNRNRWEPPAYPEYTRGFVPSDATLVCLPKNRLEKFKRDFPQAVELREYANGVVTDYLATVSKTHQEALAYSERGENHKLRLLDASLVHDPTLKEAITRAKLALDPAVTAIKTALDTWHKLDRLTGSVKTKDDTEKYPLLNAWGDDQIPTDVLPHVYTYVNAVYAAKEDA